METKHNVKVVVTTPAGYADKTAHKLAALLTKKNQDKTVTTNKENNEVTITLKTNTKETIKIQKKVAIFDKTIKAVLTNKAVKKILLKKLTEDQQEELQKLFSKETKIEITTN